MPCLIIKMCSNRLRLDFFDKFGLYQDRQDCLILKKRDEDWYGLQKQIAGQWDSTEMTSFHKASQFAFQKKENPFLKCTFTAEALVPSLMALKLREGEINK